MEFRNLEAFLKVAELKHFTQAAEQLGFVQSTITTRVQQLEEEIGTVLFERIGKKIILTPAGEQLAAYANQIVGLCNEAKEVGREDKSLTGILRIGTVESLYSSHLTTIIPLFKMQYPLITLSIRIGTGRDILQLLEKNELDMVLMLSQEKVKKNFVQVFSHPSNIVFVVSSQNAMCQSSNLTLAEILRQPLILTERHSLYRDVLTKITDKKDLQLIPSLEVNNTGIIIQLLKDGMGVSFLPNYSVQRSVKRGKLAIVTAHDWEPVAFNVQLVRHKGKWVSRPMQAFFTMLTKHMTSIFE